ncbi:hypothetical protein K2Z83_25875 [Oscillochloris sp. ZM17-4]|uniref:hypothetical protein n=1 Tax=Oscillochloris sp. ZM17-4 TaxID=2866714 RepID=UPI001C72B80B|nr:hypothetical protein [Oscillochloris sp. ZM17-4]MBX0331085.1 hypothetical protein [Oscillochloris sp. ZM17-4]
MNTSPLIASALLATDNPILTIITKVTEAFKATIVPAAGLAFMLFIFFSIIAPFVGDWATNMKGHGMRIALYLILYSMSSGLIVWLSTIAS